MNTRLHSVLASALVAAASSTVCAQDAALTLDPGDKVLIVGNTFAERLDESGYLDAMIYAAFPENNVTVRSVAWSADTVSLRPREHSVPTMLDHVDVFDPDVVFMFYGMTESYDGPEGVEAFATGLEALRTRVASKADGSAREIVLVTPIRHEALDGGEFGAWPSEGEVSAHNADLELYAAAMIENAGAADHSRVVDLFHAESIEQGSVLTTNGIHPSDVGAFWYSREIGAQLGWVEEPTEIGIINDAEARAFVLSQWGRDALVAAAADKHYFQRLIYRPTNTEYIWGRRHEPYGNVNFPAEFVQLERMTEARESRIWSMDKPSPEDLFRAYGPVLPPVEGEHSLAAVWPTLPLNLGLPEDSWTPPTIEAKGTETSLGSTTILPPEEFKSAFTLADGYVVDCFASEQDFAELANPLAMTFDERGRLWVLCAITYPHLLPGEQPRCKLLILEDTDGDGHADTRTIFADRLYIPTGFAVDTTSDGRLTAYVGQAPDLLKLTDLDGDDRADTREIVATGFGMPDSHHQVSAFEWDPAGGFSLHEGVFTMSQVETPYGPRRVRDAASWRYDPRTERLEVLSRVYFNNPWGLVFDDFGAGILVDASGGENFALSHVVHNGDYPNRADRPGAIINRGRPTAGGEIISSRHFPDDVQESFLVNQSIGFHGTRWDQLTRDGSSWSSERMPKDLIESSDTNFRPVAIETGPDGAVYIVDWCNPLIGHMQYSTRDPRRDASHGRVWRVRHETRPLVDAPDLVNATPEQLCELLRLPERNTRQLARRKIQTLPASVIESVVLPWFAELDPAMDLLYDRLMLERLWLHQATGRVDLAMLDSVASLRSERARAGAIRALRTWLNSGDATSEQAEPILAAAVIDPDMHVRIEAVIAAGFIDPEAGERVASVAADYPMDDAMAIVLRETLVYLTAGRETTNPLVHRLRLEQMSTEKLLEQEMDEVVAAVMVSRTDLPMEDRLRAVAFGGTEQAAGQSVYLFGLLANERRDDAVLAIAEVIETLPAEALAADAAPVIGALDSRNPLAGDLAASVLIKNGLEPDAVAGLSPGRLVSALGLLDAGTVSGPVIGVLRRAVEGGAAPMSDPTGALAQIARHANAADYAELFAWMSSQVDAVQSVPLSRWSADHTKAMAAARAMNSIDSAAWPEGFAAYAVDRPSAEAMAMGFEVYHNEAIGCVRCHGDDGRGLEGFPPLNLSARLLGNPEAAASIVTHGIYGPLTVSSGETFMSAMAPLGGSFTDEQVAAVLTYARNSWSNFAAPVSVEQAAAGRAKTPVGNSLWPTQELARAYPLANEGLLFEVAEGFPADLATGSATADSATGDLQRRIRGSGRVITPGMVLGIGVVGLALLLLVFGFIFAKMKKPE
ncbi:MAG: mono/diheme cytochrome c family protein [Phycisphaerales bacterium]|jgi:mono/diheme cytochrome c family protein